MSLTSSKKVETNKYELEIAVDKDTFLAAVDKVYRKNVKKITIPGFRKGKAPKSFIERYYGEGVFFEDALNLLYGEAIDSAAKEAGLTVSLNKVIAVGIPDRTGGIADTLAAIANKEVGVEYMYEYVARNSDHAYFVMRVADNEKAVAALTEIGFELLTQDAVSKH